MMEPPAPPGYAPRSSKKRAFTESGSGIGSSSAFVDDDVVEISPPPSFAKSKTAKRKQVICHNVIDVDKYGDAEDLMIIEEKFVPNCKGKRSVPSYLTVPDVKTTDAVHLFKGVVPMSHNLTIKDESSRHLNFSDDYRVNFDDCNGFIIDEECAMLQAYFDSIDMPPTVEAASPWDLSSKGSKSPGSFTNIGASKIDGSQSSWSYTYSSQSGTSGSKSRGKSFSISSSGAGPYDAQWQPAPSHVQKEPVAGTVYGMLPTGTNAMIGNSIPPETPHPSDFMNFTVPEPSKIGSGASYFFSGLGADVTAAVTGGFSYLQKPSVVLDQGIVAETSGPSNLSSSKKKDDSEVLKRLESFKKFDMVQDHSDHHYSSMLCQAPSKRWAKKIQEEWRILEKDLPDTIFVRVYETRMDLLRAVIIGAEGTPYHDGLFFFDVHFPSAYPKVPPLVYYHSGGLRLNPNLYNCGKVCLSLLNTWTGKSNEKWVPGLSSTLQVLVSIQGLILNTKPYFNEPGYAHSAGKPAGEKKSEAYNESTFLLSLKTMLYSMRRPPKHFEDFVSGHFYKHAHDILIACKTYMDGAQVGSLVKGGIQDVDEGYKSCSDTFKKQLPEYISSLVMEFTKLGVKDCEKYYLPANNTNAVSLALPKALPSNYKKMTKKKTLVMG